MNTEKLSAPGLVKMLATRHSGDVFVPECKDGPTQTRAHLRLDAWVLLKTWSPITTIGYEVKVDRGDWRRDEKLHQYMPLCHLLYVVAPKGLVPVEELPAGVGLMEPVGTSGRLQIRRKAARREIALPAELMVYVLMCRTQITRDRSVYGADDRSWRIRELQEWVNGKEDRRGLSYALSNKIREKFDAQQRDLEAERRRNDELQRVRDRIIELGFDPNQSVDLWQVQSKLQAFHLAVDDWVLRQMREAAKTMTDVAAKLEDLKRPPPSPNFRVRLEKAHV